MSRRRDNTGFVLLMVMVVLVFAGTVLAMTARRSASSALQAGARQRQLQWEWGAVSARDLLIPRANMILARAGAENDSPVIRTRRTLRLGEMDFHVVLADEQAMVSVNLLAKRYGNARFASRLGLLRDSARKALPVQLTPSPADPSSISAYPQVYSSFDQVWNYQHPRQLISPDGTSSRGLVTCWSSGKVNFTSAPQCVLDEVLAGILTHSQTAALVDFRNKEPDCTLDEALAQAQLSDEEIVKARSVLTDTSTCHSLWVMGIGRTRSWYRFHVRRIGDEANDSARWTFQW